MITKSCVNQICAIQQIRLYRTLQSCPECHCRLARGEPSRRLAAAKNGGKAPFVYHCLGRDCPVIDFTTSQALDICPVCRGKIARGGLSYDAVRAEMAHRREMRQLELISRERPETLPKEVSEPPADIVPPPPLELPEQPICIYEYDGRIYRRPCPE